MKEMYDVYSLATSHGQGTGEYQGYSLKFPIVDIQDPTKYTVKKVSPIDLLLYFGDYPSRRYKDLLSGIDPNRILSKSAQGKAVALKRKISLTRKPFSAQ
jgi:hypothetical protein